MRRRQGVRGTVPLARRIALACVPRLAHRLKSRMALSHSILKPAVQTAKHAKYAKGKGVERIRTFTLWENPSSLPIRSAFAWFAYFAVPSAFSRFILS